MERKHKFPIRDVLSSLFYGHLSSLFLYVSYYKWKYLLRKICYAWHGSFNPYMISNKEAHMKLLNPKQNISSLMEVITSLFLLKWIYLSARSKVGEICIRRIKTHKMLPADDAPIWPRSHVHWILWAHKGVQCVNVKKYICEINDKMYS